MDLRLFNSKIFIYNFDLIYILNQFMIYIWLYGGILASLSELTPIVFDMELTHLASEAFS